jgi:hypothetical protein
MMVRPNTRDLTMPPLTSRETTLWTMPEKYEPALTPNSSTPDRKASQDAHHIENGGEERHRNDPGQQFRGHHILQGVDRHGVQGVQLLGDPHDADLRGDGAPGPAGDHEPVSTGPNSRMRLKATADPKALSEPYRRRV